MNAKLKKYESLVEFLGNALGSHVEIVLQDLTGENYSIVKIVNSQISGREVGAPVTNLALQMIISGEWKDKNYVCDYYGTSVGGKILKGSTFFIKEADELIGMLCINTDVSAFREASDLLLQMAGLVQKQEEQEVPSNKEKQTIERFSDSVVDVTRTVLEEICKGVPTDRLTQNEKTEIVRTLNEKGIFLLKGAVSDVAQMLLCSEASVYRYLSRIQKNIS